MDHDKKWTSIIEAEAEPVAQQQNGQTNLIYSMKTIVCMKKIMAGTALFAIGLTGCSEQQRAYMLGQTSTVELVKGQKLINASWKHPANLWFLTRPMRPDELPETYTMTESSSFGILQGGVIIKESR